MQHQDDIRGQLREDHDSYLAELEALRKERDAQRCKTRLRELRHAWAIHSLAEETVVYRAIESGASAHSADAEERFIEHELLDVLFEKLARARPGTLEWDARLKVAGDLMRRHVEHEHAAVFDRLARLDAEALRRMCADFGRERARLARLEEPKAA